MLKKLFTRLSMGQNGEVIPKENVMEKSLTPAPEGHNVGSPDKENVAMRDHNVSAHKASSRPIWGSLTGALKAILSAIVLGLTITCALFLGMQNTEPSTGLNAHNLPAAGACLPVAPVGRYLNPDYARDQKDAKQVVVLAGLRQLIRKFRTVARHDVRFARSQWWRDLLRRWRRGVRSAARWIVNAAYEVARYLNVRTLVRKAKKVAQTPMRFNWSTLFKVLAIAAMIAIPVLIGHPAAMLAAVAPMGQQANPVALIKGAKVVYKGETFVFIGLTGAGKARLANGSGVICKSYPALNKLRVLSPLGQETDATATNVPESTGTVNAGNTGKESVAMSDQKNKDWVTFAQILKTQKKVSPLTLGVPAALGLTVVEHVGQRPRAEDTPATHSDTGEPHLFSYLNLDFYGHPSILRDLATTFRFEPGVKGGTRERIRKYIGSLVTANAMAITRIGKIETMDEYNAHSDQYGLGHRFEKGYDGVVLVRESWATALELQSELRLTGKGWSGMAVRRILTHRGLVKGMIIVIPDALMRPGVDVIASEIKNEVSLQRGLNSIPLKECAIIWQPGQNAESKRTGVFSFQPMIMLLTKAILSVEFFKLLSGYFTHFLNQLPDIIAGISAVDDEDLDENDSRLDHLRRGFAQVGLSPMITRVFANRVAKSVARDIDPEALRIRPETDKGCDLWKSYPIIGFWRLLAAHWAVAGDVPADIAAKAEMEKSLPDTDENGRAIMWTTDYEAWAENNEDPTLAVSVRTPCGPTSGTIMTVRQLPAELFPPIKTKDSFLVVYSANKYTWDTVMQNNEGADADDFWSHYRSLLARLMVKGLAWRNKLFATMNSPQESALADKLQNAIDGLMGKLLRSDSKIFYGFKADQILGTVFNIRRDKQGRAVALAEREVPMQARVSSPTNEEEAVELFRSVMSESENPFDAAVGDTANVQQWGMALAVGLVRLPKALAHLRLAFAKILTLATMLSDIIDAMKKGDGFILAHNSVQRMNKALLYLVQYLLSNPVNSGFAQLPMLAGKAGRAMRLITTSVRRIDTGRTIDGKKIYREEKNTDGTAATEVQYETDFDIPMGETTTTKPMFLDAFMRFYMAVAESVQELTEQVWEHPRRNQVGEVLRRYTTQDRFEDFLVIDGKQFSLSKLAGMQWNIYFRESGRQGEYTSRSKRYSYWKNAGKRSPKEVDAMVAWMRRPIHEGFEEMQRATIDMLQGAGYTNKEAVKVYLEMMLVLAYKYGFEAASAKAVSVEVDGFDLDIRNGIPSVATWIGLNGTLGTGDALAWFLNRPETAQAVLRVQAELSQTRTSGIAVFAVTSNGRIMNRSGNPEMGEHGSFNFSPEDFMGKTVEAILSIPGVHLALSVGNRVDKKKNYGHRAQRANIAELSDMNEAAIRRTINRIDSKRKDGIMTKEEASEALAEVREMSSFDWLVKNELAASVSRLIPGTAIRYEILTQPWAEGQYNYENTVIQVSYEVTGAVRQETVEPIAAHDLDLEFAPVTESDFSEMLAATGINSAPWAE